MLNGFLGLSKIKSPRLPPRLGVLSRYVWVVSQQTFEFRRMRNKERDRISWSLYKRGNSLHRSSDTLKMKFLFFIICLTGADLIGYNRYRNQITRHVNKRAIYSSTTVIPVQDVAKMKEALKLIELHNFEKAAELLQVVYHTKFIFNS